MHPKVRQALELALPHLDRPELIDAVTDALMRDTIRLSREEYTRIVGIYSKAPQPSLEDSVSYLLCFYHSSYAGVVHNKENYILEQYGPENPCSS
jgi:hypothetical protein